jgi:hypothetical protein
MKKGGGVKISYLSTAPFARMRPSAVVSRLFVARVFVARSTVTREFLTPSFVAPSFVGEGAL